MRPCLTTVTPFTGVWIEMDPGFDLGGQGVVTPFTGVWIEIGGAPARHPAGARHTLHGCVD